MKTLLTPEQQLAEVDALLREMPALPSFESPESDHYAWLGRASAIVHRWDPVKGLARFDALVRQMGSGSFLQTPQGAQGVLTMLHQLRYDAVLAIPTPQSVAVGSGAVFDYFDEIRKVVELAKLDILFVDPYLDAEFVSRYLPFVTNGVTVRLLGRERLAALLPAALLFQKQNGSNVSVRTAKGFHDRYVFIDRAHCFQSGASFKDGAKKSPTTLTEIVDAFRAVHTTYEAMWDIGVVHL